jgi:hypothetical protein
MTALSPSALATLVMIGGAAAAKRAPAAKTTKNAYNRVLPPLYSCIIPVLGKFYPAGVPGARQDWGARKLEVRAAFTDPASKIFGPQMNTDAHR